MLKEILKSVFMKFGFQIRKVSGPLTMGGALQRCVERGLNVNTVIDIGASDGRWSKNCMKYLPNSYYLLIEAQKAHEKGLRKFKEQHQNADYTLAAAGEKIGKIYFDNSDLLGGLASETPLDNNCIEVPVISIDSEIEKRNLKPPFLIKLDTHGFELPIIEGGQKALDTTELLIVETYNYQVTPDSLKFYQMCEHMEKLGFSPIEIVDPMLRRYDKSFWQMDIFFIKSIRKEFSYNSYK